MKKLVLTFISILCLSPFVFADSNTLKEGKMYYTNANCQKCHKFAENFNPKKHKVKNRFQLTSWTNSCAQFFKISWDSIQEESVVEYLNTYYYKFED